MAGIVHELEQKGLHEQVRQEAANAAAQLAEAAHLHKGQIVVVGCSTSEVVGKKVGSWSTPEIANAIFEGLHSVFGPMGVYIAAQCCEHLNRAIIVEHEAVPNGEIVNVVPQPKAGSSFATAAYHAFAHPVALEEIRADAGLDIGGTLIGMHLKKVAVPVRLAHRRRHSAGGPGAAQVHRRRPRRVRRVAEGRLSGVLRRRKAETQKAVPRPLRRGTAFCVTRQGTRTSAPERPPTPPQPR